MFAPFTKLIKGDNNSYLFHSILYAYCGSFSPLSDKAAVLIKYSELCMIPFFTWQKRNPFSILFKEVQFYNSIIWLLLENRNDSCSFFFLSKWSFFFKKKCMAKSVAIFLSQVHCKYVSWYFIFHNFILSNYLLVFSFSLLNSGDYYCRRTTGFQKRCIIINWL